MKIAAIVLVASSLAGVTHPNQAAVAGAVNGKSYESSSGSLSDFSFIPSFSSLGSLRGAGGSADYGWSVQEDTATAFSTSSASGVAHAYAFAQVLPETTPFKPSEPTPAVPEASNWLFITLGLGAIGALALLWQVDGTG